MCSCTLFFGNRCRWLTNFNLLSRNHPHPHPRVRTTPTFEEKAAWASVQTRAFWRRKGFSFLARIRNPNRPASCLGTRQHTRKLTYLWRGDARKQKYFGSLRIHIFILAFTSSLPSHNVYSSWRKANLCLRNIWVFCIWHILALHLHEITKQYMFIYLHTPTSFLRS